MKVVRTNSTLLNNSLALFPDVLSNINGTVCNASTVAAQNKGVLWNVRWIQPDGNNVPTLSRASKPFVHERTNSVELLSVTSIGDRTFYPEGIYTCEVIGEWTILLFLGLYNHGEESSMCACKAQQSNSLIG